MHLALTPEQERLRAELREYFTQLVTPERKAGLAASSGEFGDTAVYKEVIRQVGSDGWLGIGWPKEYGGQARSMVDQLIFTDVAADFGVPIPYLTLNTVGPLGVNAGAANGFDISGATGTAYAALRNAGPSSLYTINLSTGAASLVGPIGSGLALTGLTIIPNAGT